MKEFVLLAGLLVVVSNGWQQLKQLSYQMSSKDSSHSIVT
jgi:hypothetical protein